MKKEIIRMLHWHVDHPDIPDEYWVLKPEKKKVKKK